jgi:cell division protein FtsZ
MTSALEGLRELERSVDTLIVVPNENIFNVAGAQTPVVDAFKMNDHIVLEGIRGITDIAVKSGLINLDFADIKTAMQRGGRSFMGTGFGFDDVNQDSQSTLDTFWRKQQQHVLTQTNMSRGKAAVLAALHNPLLEAYNITQAENVILSITGNKDTTLNEIKDIANIVKQHVGSDTNMIIGAAFVDSRQDHFKNCIKVSLIITGIPRTDIKHVVEYVHNVAQKPISVPPKQESDSWLVAFIKKHW